MSLHVGSRGDGPTQTLGDSALNFSPTSVEQSAKATLLFFWGRRLFRGRELMIVLGSHKRFGANLKYLGRGRAGLGGFPRKAFVLCNKDL